MISPFLKPLLAPASLALLMGIATAAHSQQFASSVAASSNLSTDPLYSDPKAALGQPTTLAYDGYDTYHDSLPYPAYGSDPDGNNLLVSLGGTGLGSLTVKFDQAPITHSSAHWFSEDFIVFSNQFFIAQDYVTPTTDMSQFHLTDGTVFGSLPTVSVSSDGINFVTLTPADSLLFPENPYKWVGISAQNPSGYDAGQLQDFSKPVNPTLTTADFAGQTVAHAGNDLYNGSAGGTAFSLANTQFAQTGIQYIRFTGSGTVDGVSRVGNAPAPVPEMNSGWLLGAGLLFLGACLRRKSAKPTGK